MLRPRGLYLIEMKQMNDEKKIFIDTNVLIYAYSSDEVKKNATVAKLIADQQKIVISTQVINEFINVMRKKRAVPIEALQEVVRELASIFTISLVSIETINHALAISQNFKYSYFDSLIIASAIENSCSVLYSEDMHHKHMVSKELIILNPFA